MKEEEKVVWEREAEMERTAACSAVNSFRPSQRMDSAFSLKRSECDQTQT